MKVSKRTRIILVLYAISVCLVSLVSFSIEPDYFWHIKAGDYMFNNGILRYDVFSWSMNGKYWMSHEWLFELIIYFFKIVFGKAHIFIYCFLCICLLMGILFFTNKSNIFKNLRFSMFWLVLFFICMPFVQVRPHLLSFSLLAVTIYLLFDLYNNKKSKKIYFLPLVSIFWSNVHGGSSNLPYILCIVFVICGLFNFNFNKIEAKKLDKIQIKKYLLVMFLCMISVCINIHGFNMFTYPYQNMINKDMMSVIVEWRSTSLNNLSDYVYILFLLFILIVLLFSKKKISLIDLVLFAFCIFLGMKSIRFWFYTYIVMTYVVFNYVDEANNENCLLEFGMIVLSFVYLLAFFINVNVLIPKKISLNLDSKDISYIKKIKPKRLFNLYDYGGELIYNDIKVFIDGRADLYSSGDIFRDYIDISYLVGDFNSLLTKYNFDYYLVEKDCRLDYYFKYNDKFKIIYMNGNIKIYEKKN